LDRALKRERRCAMPLSTTHLGQYRLREAGARHPDCEKQPEARGRSRFMGEASVAASANSRDRGGASVCSHGHLFRLPRWLSLELRGMVTPWISHGLLFRLRPDRNPLNPMYETSELPPGSQAANSRVFCGSYALRLKTRRPPRDRTNLPGVI
jgi:hypothetical protein